MVLRGLPPGSVLGPLLFNIFVNYLNFCVTKYNVNAYADDDQLHFSCECPAAIETAINEDLKESMYNSFILSHLNNCSMVWHFCLKSDSDKLEKLHEHATQSVFQDKENDYQYLLNRANKTTLYNHRLQNISILIYKALNNPILRTYLLLITQIINLEDLIFYPYLEYIMVLNPLGTLDPKYGISWMIIWELNLIFNLLRNL